MQIRDMLTAKRLRHLEPMVLEITVEQLNAKINDGEIFRLVEVSNLSDYQSNHIEGAIHIPLSALEVEASQRFKKFQQIIIYTKEASSAIGMVAVRKLQALGFSNVLLLRGGCEAWRNAGLPLVENKEQIETAD